MGHNAHGAYECTCHIHANHEKPIFQHAGFWHGSVFGRYPCVLMYGIIALYITIKKYGELVGAKK